MKSRDFDDGPKTLLYSLFEKNSQGSDAALRLESLFIQLIMTANRILAEAQLDGAALFGKDVNQYRALERLSSVEEKEQYILNLFQKPSVHIRSSRAGKTAEIYQWMLEYVKEHYKEDLSLNELSYQLQLSPSYLSSIFKEYHHDTFCCSRQRSPSPPSPNRWATPTSTPSSASSRKRKASPPDSSGQNNIPKRRTSLCSPFFLTFSTAAIITPTSGWIARTFWNETSS